jgi:hypothetical protein
VNGARPGKPDARAGPGASRPFAASGTAPPACAARGAHPGEAVGVFGAVASSRVNGASPGKSEARRGPDGMGHGSKSVNGSQSRPSAGQAVLLILTFHSIEVCCCAPGGPSTFRVPPRPDPIETGLTLCDIRHIR